MCSSERGTNINTGVSKNREAADFEVKFEDLIQTHLLEHYPVPLLLDV